MRHKFITRNLTWTGIIGMWVWYVLAGAALVAVSGSAWGLVPLVVVLGGMVFITATNGRRIKRREKDIAALIAAYPGAQLMTGPGENDPWFRAKLGAIDELHNARDPQVTNVIGTPDWTYGDFTYNIYGKTKGGEYLRTKVYYGVMTTQLPRALPHVFFDSIKARRRQFRFHFNADQRHSLEGDFDRHFVTYFPNGYTIDSMSFISPEVMWALRDARDYDIEIYGNRLFLYGPLYDPKAQIQDMSQKVLAIKKELLNNIVTYRDERLPFAEGRKGVAIAGASLKLSKFWKIMGWAGIIVYILSRIALEIWNNS